jgi:serine/threonine-protein kinase
MGISFGPYELLERLGEGGMAEVWLARKPVQRGAIEHAVCIKRIRGDQRGDPEAAERFMREARVLGRLDHEHIARVYDAGQIGDEYFIEMEYLHGKDLRTFIKAQEMAGPAPPGIAVTVAIDVARALHHAHRLTSADGEPTPIVHRDVTTANVMIGFDGSIKLVDFGLAKARGVFTTRLTATGVFVGTLGYIAPEVQRGEEASPASDQFSLGVVFYEALTGNRLLDRVIAVERPPSQCNQHVPAALDAVCLRALAVDPAERYPSCEAFAAAVAEAAPGLHLGETQVAALLAEGFSNPGQRMLTVASETAPEVAAAVRPAELPSTVVVPSLPVTAAPQRPGTRRRKTPTPTRWGLVVAMVVVPILIALAVRLWREHRLEAPVVPPTVATPPSPVPDPPTALTSPPASNPALTHPPAATSPKKRKHRRGFKEDDMGMMSPRF